MIVLKDFVWFLSGPVCYFRLAKESDDFVAKSVGSNFYYFVTEISL